MIQPQGLSAGWKFSIPKAGTALTAPIALCRYCPGFSSDRSRKRLEVFPGWIETVFETLEAAVNDITEGAGSG
jgi:hypothetical protein